MRCLLFLVVTVTTLTARAGEPPALRVAAAANLRPALVELAAEFERANPGVQVLPTYGASGAFVAQVRNGAPFDVFLSADREAPRELVRLGLAADEVVYAIGQLVLWVPSGSPLDVERRGLAALADPAARRIALANPRLAPYGRAAEAALRAAGIRDRVEGRLVLGESVAQTAQFAVSGAADAAFLPRSLARAPALARAGRFVSVPEKDHAPIEQSGAVLLGARAPALARAFLAFLASARGRALLEAHGYGVP